jgi:hypothetical protein
MVGKVGKGGKGGKRLSVESLNNICNALDLELKITKRE